MTDDISCPPRYLYSAEILAHTYAKDPEIVPVLTAPWNGEKPTAVGQGPQMAPHSGYIR